MTYIETKIQIVGERIEEQRDDLKQELSHLKENLLNLSFSSQKSFEEIQITLLDIKREETQILQEIGNTLI